MKKIVLFMLCSALLFCTGCSELSEQEPVSKEEAPEITVEESVYLELHFGNGEVLRKEIDYLNVPNSRYSGGFYYSSHYYFEESAGTLLTAAMADPFTKPYVTLCTVVFKDGDMYSLHNVRSAEVNAETRTLIAYLWRDNPRETEREYFEVVEKDEK